MHWTGLQKNWTYKSLQFFFSAISGRFFSMNSTSAFVKCACNGSHDDILMGRKAEVFFLQKSFFIWKYFFVFWESIFLQKYEHLTPGKVLAKYASPSQSDPSQATLFLKREISLMRQCYKSGLDFHIFKHKSVICCTSSQCNAGREEEVSVAQIVRASKTVSVLCIHSSIHTTQVNLDLPESILI